MSNKIKIDKALHIEQAKEAGRYIVTQVRGLYLDVRRMRDGEITPMRVWTLRIMHGYKRNAKGESKPNIVERTIGYHPETTLSDARETAILWAREIRGGGEVGKQAKGRKVQPEVITFKHAAETVQALRDSSWKSDVHRQQWRQTLEHYAFPIVGHIPVANVTREDVLAVLMQPDENEHTNARRLKLKSATKPSSGPLWIAKTATARKLKSRLGMILEWAVESGLRNDNPAKSEFENSLAKKPKNKKHHAALHYAEAPKFMIELRKLDSVSALALEFTILTGARTSEAIGAKWDEVKGDVWTVPPARMKGGKEHRVPLSPTALAVLEKVRALSRGDWIFPSRISKLSNMAMLECLRGLQTGLTVHGFRSTYRDWAAEQTDYPHEVCEAALAHTVSSAVVSAYRRTSFFDKRRDLLNDWADYLDGKEPAASRNADNDEVAALKAQIEKQAAQIDALIATLSK